MSGTILEVKNLYKSFLQPDKIRLVVLQDLYLEVKKNTIIAVTGVSGSGKSTLLHLVGSLDKPDKGEILFSGKDIFSFNDRRTAEYRNNQVGFIYQFHYLMRKRNRLQEVKNC